MFREVVVNMLIHREFLNPYPAKFIIETHRLFTENRSKPHGHSLIDPANFSPFPKNPVIARFVKEIGRADELGSGVRNLFKYCRHYSAGKTPELIDEDIFKCIIPLSPEAVVEVTGEVTPEVIPEVTPEVRRLLAIMNGEMTRGEIQERLGLKDEKHFRENYQQVGVKLGLIEMTIPDKPRSSKQKYRLTDKGKAFLEQTKG